MGLSRYETETIINFNDEESEARIYTCNRALIKKFDDLCRRFPKTYHIYRQDEYSKTYVFPKTLVSFRTVREKKVLTPEEKEAAKARARVMHQARINSKAI